MTRPDPHASYREHVSSKAEAVEEDDAEWLIVKRGLYFRPECKGYTGIRDEAGIFTHDFAKDYEGSDGIKIVRLADAAEFTPEAYHDLVIKHLTKQRDEACAQLATARKALQSVSTQCGNVIYNCEQRPVDNKRHLDSWHNVKEFADAALNSGEQKQIEDWPYPEGNPTCAQDLK